MDASGVGWGNSHVGPLPALSLVQAERRAEVRLLEDSGAPVGNLDIMIAAQALAAGATLVTHDRVFRRVKGLRIEDWTKAG